MTVLGGIITFLSLGFIAVQDFVSRSVYWWLFVFLFIGVLFFLPGIEEQPFNLSAVLANICLLLMVVSLTGMYYFVVYRRLAFSKIKGSVGLGDLLMLPVFIVSFSPVNFIFFFIVSIVIALVGSIIQGVIRKGINTIPLAGYWSLMLLICFIGAWAGFINLKDDSWFYLWQQI